MQGDRNGSHRDTLVSRRAARCLGRQARKHIGWCAGHTKAD